MNFLLLVSPHSTFATVDDWNVFDKLGIALHLITMASTELPPVSTNCENEMDKPYHHHCCILVSYGGY